MYSDFLTLAMDPIVNQAAKARYMFGGQASVPMVVRTNSGAPGGKAAQHSQSLEAWFMHVPGLKVVTPTTPYDAKGLLKAAIRDDDPVIFLEHKRLYFTKGHVPREEYWVPLGEAVVRRPGRDVTVVANQLLVNKALDAAVVLAAEGIDIEVIDVRTISPLDMATISASVRRTGRLVIAHEANRTAGWGAEVAARAAEADFRSLDGAHHPGRREGRAHPLQRHPGARGPATDRGAHRGMPRRHLVPAIGAGIGDAVITAGCLIYDHVSSAAEVCT